jgi:transposase
MPRRAYPSDVTDEEWLFVSPYLTLMREDAPQREHDLREVFNGYKRKNGSKVHMAVDTLGLLLDLLVTPANEQERRQVEALGKAVQRATDNSVTTAFADQGYTGGQAEGDARKAGMELVVVKPPEAKKGFVLLPRRWVVERSFAWTARFRRLARDFERTPEVLRGLHFVAFAILMLPNFFKTIAYLL